MRIALIFLTLFGFHLIAYTQSDTVFRFDEFRNHVLNFHPVAQQAKLQSSKGASTVLRARGNFDPKLGGTIDQKQYKGKDYYNLTSANVKLPTRFAAELKGGYDLNKGDFLNPEDVTPNQGLFTAGISLPILQGLMTDERRTALRIAKAFREYSENERRIILNDLLYKAYNSYWEWWSNYEKLQVAREIERVTTERFVAVKQRALSGLSPLIDTLEAHIQMQMRRQNVQDVMSIEIKSRMMLSSFMWDAIGSDERTPRVLIESYVPERPLLDALPSSADLLLSSVLIDSIARGNPYLRQFTWKLASLQYEERWKREKLKPKLNINYNALSYSPSGEESVSFSTNNYKWGMEMSFPVLLRESRGDVQLQKIKILETELELQQKTQEIANKARAALANNQLISNQVNIARENVNNYRRLLEAERVKFFNGESSLFIVNQRELQYVDASNKLIDLESKLQFNNNEFLWLTGTIE
jgi:outer membrane protein TolC